MPSIIGLMSGTSLDGIDAVQVKITGTQTDLNLTLQAGLTYPYPDRLRSRLLDLCADAQTTVTELASLDDQVAESFAAAALAVQDKAIAQGHPPAERIGSHGQTIFHRPPLKTLGYTWQLGRGCVIAQKTGLPTVWNFREADIITGGQGAPLVPAIDRYLLGHLKEYRCIQNIGGIGNVTYLPPLFSTGEVRGWDTGPGNSLLDLAVQQLTDGQQRYDDQGQWAAQGQPHPELLAEWLQEPFFQQPPPKSTGRELFGVQYVNRCWQAAQAKQLSPADFLATLTELTVQSIVQSYRNFLPEPPDRVLVSGGGVHNTHLLQRLAQEMQPIPVESTDAWGVNSDFKEAIAFAVLAHWYHLKLPGNLPSVTGAKRWMILGQLAKPVPAG